MPKYSKYTIVVDNISSSTPSRDIEAEFRYAGRIRDMARDHKTRCALIEYERSADAEYAWRKLNGISMNGRKMKVEWATKADFKLMGWKWYEYTPSPPPKRGRSPARSPSRSRSRSRSPSASRSPSRSPSRSRSHSRNRSPSQSPPGTPKTKEDKQERRSSDDGK